MPNKIIPTLTIIAIVSLFFTAFNPYLFPVEVKKKEVHRFEDFQEGEFKGTGLDSKGRLFIGPRIKEIPGPGREYYLSLDMALNGDIYVGTGHNASVYKIKAAAAAPGEEIFQSDRLDVYALLVKKNGDVYAGTSPEGAIYKISKDAKDKAGEKFFNPDEKFIWDLKEDITGDIICAVGNGGGVYKIDPTGSGTKIFTPEDTHIISLYITRGNSILAGSGDRGVLYRIDNRKVKVLYDSPFEEIRGICQDKEGNIYFSATTGIYSQNVLKNAAVASLVKKKKKEEERKEIKPPEKSVLYCLHTNGVVEKIWQSKTEYIYSVFYHKKTDSVIIGTGNSGRVYRVKKDGAFSIIYESDSAQIFKIAGKNKGFTVIANNTAGIAQIEDNLNSKGVYYSDIYDLEIQSKLGRLYWESRAGARTEVLLFIRTGNSNVPDKTWTPWSAPFSDKDNSVVNISECRYFQVKAVLNSTDITDSPYLDSFKVYYVQSNLSPQLKKIEIIKPLPRKNLNRKSNGKEVKNNNYLDVWWRAADRNKDKLKYNIFIKKYTAKHWILVKEDITENRLELNTELYEDGKYLLRVAADDSLANPPSLAQSTTMESTPFLIDSTAPVVTDFSVTGKRILFLVKDKTSVISRVLYSFDGKLWYPVFPIDMINDSKSEKFDFNLKDLPVKKFIFLKVMDEFDNCKVFQKEF